jgi:hypothetical protein
MNQFLSNTYVGGLPVLNDDVAFVSNGLMSGITDLIYAIVKSANTFDNMILWGVNAAWYLEHTPRAYIGWSDGAVMVSGVLYHVYGGEEYNPNGYGPAIYLNISPTYDPRGTKTFNDLSVHDTYLLTTAKPTQEYITGLRLDTEFTQYADVIDDSFITNRIGVQPGNLLSPGKALVNNTYPIEQKLIVTSASTIEMASGLTVRGIPNIQWTSPDFYLSAVTNQINLGGSGNLQLSGITGIGVKKVYANIVYSNTTAGVTARFYSSCYGVASTNIRNSSILTVPVANQLLSADVTLFPYNGEISYSWTNYTWTQMDLTIVAWE